MKPISPGAHGAIDYGLSIALLTAPKLLGMGNRACAVFGAIGLSQGTVNALTAQPLTLKPLIPFKTHRMIDMAAAPTYSLLPVLAGITKEPRVRALWLTMAAGLATVYALTDWDAVPRP